jgi:hypothetical protein
MSAPPVADVVAELRRELKMRQRVYPRWVLTGKMTAADMASRIAALEELIALIECEQAPELPL